MRQFRLSEPSAKPRSSSQPIPLDTLPQMMRDPRYWNPRHPENQAWVTQVTDGFRAHYPSEMTYDATGRQTDDVGHSGTVHVDAYVRTVDGKEVQVSEHERGWPISSGHRQSDSHAADIEVPNAPPGVNIDDNIREAFQHDAYSIHGDLWFLDQVNYGHPWDYKTLSLKKYEEFGNFNYGATGAAMGYSEDTLLRMAGWAQNHYSKSKSEWGEVPSLAEAFFGNRWLRTFWR